MTLKHAEKMAFWLAIALVVYMPLHIFLSQSLSLLTGGLETWKAAKDVIFVITVPFLLWLAYVQGALKQRFFRRFVLLGGVYTLLYFVFLLVHRNPDIKTAITGSVYNTRILGYFLLGYVIALSKNAQAYTKILTKTVLIMCLVVAGFGILQYFLPKDFLTHFGYSIPRGVKPIFYINEDPRFTRIMSTLRDPNSLGAYLLAPICYWGLRFFRQKKLTKGQALNVAILLAAFYLTLSRAAWLGLVVGSIILGIRLFGSQRLLLVVKRHYLHIICLLALMALGIFLARNTTYVRQDLLRINDANKGSNQLNSDQYHLKFVEDGLKSIAKNPIGYGAGTAGIVSIQNSGGTFLTEDYYLQIGHEVGVLGLLLFAAILTLVLLEIKKSNSNLGVSLFATGLAYIVMSFVMHLWSNEALAVQWWLLAGIVCASNPALLKLKLRKRGS